jgi:hypothetical protein
VELNDVTPTSAPASRKRLVGWSTPVLHGDYVSEGSNYHWDLCEEDEIILYIKDQGTGLTTEIQENWVHPLLPSRTTEPVRDWRSAIALPPALMQGLTLKLVLGSCYLDRCSCFVVSAPVPPAGGLIGSILEG